MEGAGFNHHQETSAFSPINGGDMSVQGNKRLSETVRPEEESSFPVSEAVIDPTEKRKEQNRIFARKSRERKRK